MTSRQCLISLNAFTMPDAGQKNETPRKLFDLLLQKMQNVPQPSDLPSKYRHSLQPSDTHRR